MKKQSQREYHSEMLERARADFANHVAILAAHGPYQRLIWGQPGTNLYRIHYTAIGGALYVSGDCYEATYLSGGQGLAFWAQTDSSYMQEKARATPPGDQQTDWDQGVAAYNLDEFTKDIDGPARDKLMAMDADTKEALWSRQEWHYFLEQHGDVLFGDGWQDWAGGLGTVRPMWAIWHHVGLRMAWEQINSRGLERVA